MPTTREEEGPLKSRTQFPPLSPKFRSAFFDERRENNVDKPSPSASQGTEGHVTILIAFLEMWAFPFYLSLEEGAATDKWWPSGRQGSKEKKPPDLLPQQPGPLSTHMGQVY